ncbi:MAG TPA: hypothetical protein V6D07_15170 [Trichocoleus sp.]
MSYNNRVALLMGLAALTAGGGALPASANVATQDTASVIQSEAIEVAFESSLDLPTPKAPSEVAPLTLAQEATPAEAAPTVADASEETSVEADAATSATLLEIPEAVVTPDSTEIALAPESVEFKPTLMEGDVLAQATRGDFAGVAPNYLGIGGNLGLSDSSPLSDMGFAVISKISLGTRFSVRPAAVIAEGGTSFLIPATFNFSPTTFGGFTAQPYVGAGVDIPTRGDLGLLVNAGVDVPISSTFTLNATSNFRLTSGFGLGIIVGVGYNFPGFFE